MIARDLSLDLESCNNWLINNKLSLHVGKTELILFGSCKQLKQAANFHISYNGYDIQPVSSLKYLGVLIDQHLSCQAMVESIIKNATSRLKFLYRHSLYFNQKLCKNLCPALLQCHLDYCCTSWFHGLSNTMHLGTSDHVGQDQYESVKILDTQNRSRQLRLNHMFNIFHSLDPSYFNQFFTKISDIQSHATTSSSFNFHIPRIGSYAKHSFFYQATLDWNNLPFAH